MIAAPTVRQLLETAIETLISLLDVTDTDPDLEDGGDAEPGCDDEGWLEDA